MRKAGLLLNLSIIFLREGDKFIAYSPALDFSTSGSSFKQAKERFAEAVRIFFKEIIKRGTLNEVLEELGWKKHNREWRPPVIVSQEIEAIRVPVAV